MNLNTLKPIVTKPSQQSREKQAAFMKERLYGAVTLLAVNFGLLAQTGGGLTIKQAFITILTTTFGLWAASLLASVLAYRVVHDKNMPRKDFVYEVTVHRGLLLAAVPSVLMLSLAGLDVIELRTAIIADITLALTAMGVTILRSAKTESNSFVTAAISIALQTGFAVAVIVLKLGGH